MATGYRGRWAERTGVAARLLCGLAFAASVGLALPPALAQETPDRTTGLSPVAQAQTRDFDIPAQPLTSALTAFGDQAGLQVTADTAIVSGRTAPTVSGRMTPEEALRRLLAGSGIAWRYVDAGTVALQQATADGDGGATALDPITVEGKTESAYGPVEGYRSERSATATKTDTPIRDIPNSIQVVPRQIITDQQAINLVEVLDNAAGVTFFSNQVNSQLDFAIRGFSDAPILRDGLSLYGVASAPAEVEVANLERAEVLRGPSVLYGQVEPGGAINIVTKKPLDEPYYNFEFQAGNRNLFSPIADISGPVTDDGSLLFRMVALYRQQDSFQDYDTSFKRVFVAPSATWRPTRDTDLTLRLEYARDRDPFLWGLPALGEGIADIPFDRVMNNPDDTFEKDTLIAGYEAEHRFSENWKLRNQFSYIYGQYDWGVFAFPFALNEATGELNRFFANQVWTSETFTTDAGLQGNFSTGPLDHTLLFGLDYSTVAYDAPSRFDFSTLTPINIFDPDYSAIPKPRASDLPLAVDTKTELRQAGLYVQDQVKLLDNLIVVGGFRVDDFSSRTKDRLTDAITQDIDERAFTPRVGAVYRPLEPISLYASYSESFEPNIATDSSGNVLPPEEGQGVEVSVKIDFIPDRLSSTLAFYNITKQNVSTTDPANPLFSVATGEQRSRGFDADLTGEILPGWNVVAGYAFIDTEVTRDNDTDLVGNELAGVPRHSANLWTTYEIQGGRFKGLGGGIGFNYVGERKGDLANTYMVDSYVVTNAGLFYRWRNWQARLNFNNIFDVEYIEGTSGSRVRNDPGAPFTIRGSISATF